MLLPVCLINFLTLTMFFLPPLIKEKAGSALFFALIINALTWFGLGNIVIGLLMLVLVVMNYYTQKKPVVFFYKDYILYPSFPTRKIYWKDLEEVIIKDDILTIDFKNNALIQQKIESQNNESINIMAFNAFIRTKLGGIKCEASL